MMATGLSHRQSEHKILPPNEALRLYATDLAAQSFCLDVSSDPVQLLHASSGYKATMKELEYGYPAWASRKGVWVSTDEYPDLIRNIGSRLPPLMHRVYGVAFKPVSDRFFDRSGVKLANIYVPFRPEICSQFVMPSILEEYLRRVLPNEEDRAVVVMWMADILQNPLRRPMWGVLLTGQGGAGKSSLIRLVRLALGGRHVWAENSYTPAFSRFSEVLCNNLLVAFDDAPTGTNTYEMLKLAVDRPILQVERKGIQGYVERDVYSRILICSNHPRPLRFDENERRFYVPEPCRHLKDKEDTEAFFVRFNSWLDLPGSAEIIYHWLMSVDLRSFVHGHTVHTETCRRMIGLSASVGVCFCEELRALFVLE